MQSNVVAQEDDDEPTVRDAPSGRWVIAVDRAQGLIRTAIERLEGHDEIEDVGLAIEDLRRAETLAGGRAT